MSWRRPKVYTTRLLVGITESGVLEILGILGILGKEGRVEPLSGEGRAETSFNGSWWERVARWIR